MNHFFRAISYLLTVFSLLCCYPTVAQSSVKMPLVMYGNRGASMHALNPCVLVETKQNSSTGTFDFVLELKNDSSKAVKIKDPFELLYIDLINEKRKPSVFESELKSFRERNDFRPLFHAFSVKRIRLNGIPYDFKPWQSQVLTLPAHSKFQSVITVSQFINPNVSSDTPIHRPTAVNQVRTLRRGNYRFSIFVALRSGNKSDSFVSKYQKIVVY